MNRPGRKIGLRDHLLGAALCAAYVVLLLATSDGLAMSRDESFYVIAAERYGAWLELLVESPSAAIERSAVDRHWSYNHEHPPLAKVSFALSNLAHEELELFSMPSMAHRFPGMLSAGFLLWLIYIFGARAYGRPAGAFGAGAFALLPRFFYHAHLNAFDVPITLMATLTVYAYWRSLGSRAWALALGPIFGLALATKHNSWILPGIFAIHFAWMAIAELRHRREGDARRMSLFPYWLPSMALIGPLVFWALWPWIWFETLSRLEEYARFHLNHAYYNMAYFGVNYFRPPFPIHFPLVMTLFTVPLTVLLLAVGGLWERLPAMMPKRLSTLLFPSSTEPGDRWRTDVLVLGCMLAPLVVIALPSTPIFGGTKHWFPAYPFVCLFAGLGFWRLSRIVRSLVGDHLPVAKYSTRALVASLLLLPSVVETKHSHMFGLSHYTFAAGGVPGAADWGMNRQFWGFTTGSLAGFFEEELPDGGTVFLCDTTPGAFQMMKRDGLLPQRARPVGSMHHADFVLVHHEDHFAEVDYQAWVAFGSPSPVHVVTHDGVPIVSVYENPRRRNRRAAP